MKAVTQWFSMNGSPARRGLYQISMNGTIIGYSYYNGEHWGKVSSRAYRVGGLSLAIAIFPEDYKWRGLANKP
jgi:hypothetical protein